VCLDLPYQFRAMSYYSTCSAYVNIVQFLYFREKPMAAYSVAGAILVYSVIMYAKLGLYLTLVLCSSFIVVLVVGYKIDVLLFQSAVEMGIIGSKRISESESLSLLAAPIAGGTEA
jgi:hypothetical protein